MKKKWYKKRLIFIILGLNGTIEYMDHLHSFCLWTHNVHNVALVLLNTTLLNHILVQRPFNFPCIIPTDWNISNFGQHVTPTERLLKRKFNVEGTIYTVCLERCQWCMGKCPQFSPPHHPILRVFSLGESTYQILASYNP